MRIWVGILDSVAPFVLASSVHPDIVQKKGGGGGLKVWGKDL